MKEKKLLAVLVFLEQKGKSLMNRNRLKYGIFWTAEAYVLDSIH